MRVWVDISNSPQVPFFRPLLALLRERGHTVDVTTREYAQTLELLRLHGIEHEAVGPPHGGAGRVGKARALTGRLRALRAYARGREFDLALSHASHELPLVARSLRIPSAYAFDYEFATVQHGLGCRARSRCRPRRHSSRPARRLGARAAKVRRLPRAEGGVLPAGFEPDAPFRALGLDGARARRRADAPEVSLYHRHGSPLFADVLERLGSDRACARSCYHARRNSGRFRRGGLPSLVVPERALDAQSLVAPPISSSGPAGR